MSTVAAAESTIAIELGCDSGLEACRELAEREYVGTYYSAPKYPLSVAELDDWRCSRVVRENCNRAARLGYRSAIIDRADWVDDLNAIRASKRIRQGRPMPAAYLEPQSYSSDPLPHEQACRRHMTVVHGVITADVISADETLVAYCQLVQAGDVVRVNTILGHWDFMADRVVWLLVRDAIEWHRREAGARFALYFTHDSGHGGGLRYFKERFGFRPADVEWRFA